MATSELRTSLSRLWLKRNRPFSSVKKRSNVYGDFLASVGGVVLPGMEAIESGEVSLRMTIAEIAGLRQINKKNAQYKMELRTGWDYWCSVERDHDSIFLTIAGHDEKPLEHFDRVELSRHQIVDEITALKKNFLRIAEEGSSRSQAEELWENISGEYVDDVKNKFWNW